jgi:hypothetical protein
VGGDDLKGKMERFWILDFGFWILDFGFWILDFGLGGWEVGSVVMYEWY